MVHTVNIAVIILKLAMFKVLEIEVIAHTKKYELIPKIKYFHFFFKSSFSNFLSKDTAKYKEGNMATQTQIIAAYNKNSESHTGTQFVLVSTLKPFGIIKRNSKRIAKITIINICFMVVMTSSDFDNKRIKSNKKHNAKQKRK